MSDLANSHHFLVNSNSDNSSFPHDMADWTTLDDGLSVEVSKRDLPVDTTPFYRQDPSQLFPSTLNVDDSYPSSLNIEDPVLNGVSPVPRFQPDQKSCFGHNYVPGFSSLQSTSAANNIHQSYKSKVVPASSLLGAMEGPTPFPPSESSWTMQDSETSSVYHRNTASSITFCGPTNPREHSFLDVTSHFDQIISNSSQQEFANPWCGPRPGVKYSASQSSAASLTSSKGVRKELKQCRHCGKLLANAEGLRRHEATHNDHYKDGFRHECEVCGHRAKSPKDINRHMLKHNKSRIVICVFPGCGQKLQDRRDNAKRHVVKQHKVHRAIANYYIQTIRTETA
ncbi:uncharacterized protein PV09_03085 [Verruconis gallopava]|uniref:C2H2-type domain-containing protein n=1 Tax=Verruconis gallopava TaxID=253628 RepID=A0A0D2AH49_9PEZI|nr:uncharacterized protein PV09_03085 [Verruconis gallopava]KIW05890.1 hypothetical protein PV09_03085 [Verruconis gallopava]